MTADQLIIGDDVQATSSPFEGPEKLLEVWFAPDYPVREDGRRDATGGLRGVPQQAWEDMLAIVKCKVLSVIRGTDVDAYLLSESSFFVFPHKLILKTCGTTLNLLGLPRILALAREHCGFTAVWRCFYSRKSFMFPERQLGPHKDWTQEITFLDGLFRDTCPGAAYTVGKVNGDHWLLYLTTPEEDEQEIIAEAEAEIGAGNGSGSGSSGVDGDQDQLVPVPAPSAGLPPPAPALVQDYTLEILMSRLAAPAREPFFFPTTPDAPSAHTQGAALAAQLGITSLFPAHRTMLDSYAFEPCGYSANALVRLNDNDNVNESENGRDSGGSEGYYTIHVTPEEGWSYASFESNVPVSIRAHHHHHDQQDADDALPDLHTLIRRVVGIFQPGHLSITLFVSADTSFSPDSDNNTNNGNGNDEATAESAQLAFFKAIVPAGYKRTDKINYEFGEYELAFASFEKKGAGVGAGVGARRNSSPVQVR
ncbi:hypothetical protein BOTBODRAFT_168912 [Botryobasidium botryosum FD-172 SS1]|uniref:Uncharacterized protein n=1 Tax=Botryobasidium botryosum (strain FD-172 SS1) TaxID=930990 RepID=A0A067N105_BOTB1|nr:hypothetical protein BOTBODRAFT_168912 [Botryobasidium botryosum FD-172 SS1]